MPPNPFESSRVASGTMNAGAQKPNTPPAIPSESSAISRDDKRDVSASGVEPPVPVGRMIVPASNLLGNHVRNPAGESLGIIEQVMLDIPRGCIAYAVLSFGGFLGIGDKLFAVPWNALRIDPAEDEFTLDVDRKMLENAPGFDKESWPDMADPGFTSAIHNYYGQTPSSDRDNPDGKR